MYWSYYPHRSRDSLSPVCGIFVEHHIKQHATKHASFLQDTQNFLRHIEKLNLEAVFNENTLLDAIGCYMNIPQEEGVQCVENILSTRQNQEVPSGFIARLLELILKHNIFEIDNELYQQQVGTAMGCKPAPSYANIHLAQKIDQQILEIAKMLSECVEIPIKLLKRFFR